MNICSLFMVRRLKIVKMSILLAFNYQGNTTTIKIPPWHFVDTDKLSNPRLPYIVLKKKSHFTILSIKIKLQ